MQLKPLFSSVFFNMAELMISIVYSEKSWVLLAQDFFSFKV